MLMVVILVSLGFYFLGFMLSKKVWGDKSKLSPFECGFSPFEFYRLPLSVQFFLVSLMFLIFDIELSIIFSMVISSGSMTWFLLSNCFVVFLFFSVLGEWWFNSLSWVV